MSTHSESSSSSLAAATASKHHLSSRLQQLTATAAADDRDDGGGAKTMNLTVETTTTASPASKQQRNDDDYDDGRMNATDNNIRDDAASGCGGSTISSPSAYSSVVSPKSIQFSSRLTNRSQYHAQRRKRLQLAVAAPPPTTTTTTGSAIAMAAVSRSTATQSKSNTQQQQNHDRSLSNSSSSTTSTASSTFADVHSAAVTDSENGGSSSSSSGRSYNKKKKNRNQGLENVKKKNFTAGLSSARYAQQHRITGDHNDVEERDMPPSTKSAAVAAAAANQQEDWKTFIDAISQDVARQIHGDLQQVDNDDDAPPVAAKRTKSLLAASSPPPPRTKGKEITQLETSVDKKGRSGGGGVISSKTKKLNLSTSRSRIKSRSSLTIDPVAASLQAAVQLPTIPLSSPPVSPTTANERWKHKMYLAKERRKRQQMIAAGGDGTDVAATAAAEGTVVTRPRENTEAVAVANEATSKLNQQKKRFLKSFFAAANTSSSSAKNKNDIQKQKSKKSTPTMSTTTIKKYTKEAITGKESQKESNAQAAIVDYSSSGKNFTRRISKSSSNESSNSATSKRSTSNKREKKEAKRKVAANRSVSPAKKFFSGLSGSSSSAKKLFGGIKTDPTSAPHKTGKSKNRERATPITAPPAIDVKAANAVLAMPTIKESDNTSKQHNNSFSSLMESNETYTTALPFESATESQQQVTPMSITTGLDTKTYHQVIPPDVIKNNAASFTATAAVGMLLQQQRQQEKRSESNDNHSSMNYRDDMSSFSPSAAAGKILANGDVIVATPTSATNSNASWFSFWDNRAENESLYQQQVAAILSGQKKTDATIHGIPLSPAATTPIERKKQQDSGNEAGQFVTKSLSMNQSPTAAVVSPSVVATATSPSRCPTVTLGEGDDTDAEEAELVAIAKPSISKEASSPCTSTDEDDISIDSNESDSSNNINDDEEEEEVPSNTMIVSDDDDDEMTGCQPYQGGEEDLSSIDLSGSIDSSSCDTEENAARIRNSLSGPPMVLSKKQIPSIRSEEDSVDSSHTSSSSNNNFCLAGFLNVFSSLPDIKPADTIKQASQTLQMKLKSHISNDAEGEEASSVETNAVLQASGDGNNIFARFCTFDKSSKADSDPELLNHVDSTNEPSVLEASELASKESKNLFDEDASERGPSRKTLWDRPSLSRTQKIINQIDRPLFHKTPVRHSKFEKRQQQHQKDSTLSKRNNKGVWSRNDSNSTASSADDDYDDDDDESIVEEQLTYDEDNDNFEDDTQQRQRHVRSRSNATAAMLQPQKTMSTLDEEEDLLDLFENRLCG